MNKFKVFILSVLVFVLAASGIYYFFPNPKRQCSVVERPVSSGQLEFLPGRSPLDTSVLTLNNEVYFILTYMTGSHSSYKSTPVYFFPLKNKLIQTKESQTFGESEHVRHFTKVKTPWGEGALMADHGSDGGTYDGGNILLVVHENNRLSDKSATLKQKRNFAFNAVALKNPQTSFDDILIVPFNGPKSKVAFLSYDGSGYADKSELLPADWTRFSVCFMTAMPFDADDDRRDEVVLGACDLNPEQNPQGRDRLLTFKNGRWNFEGDVFPLRKRDSTWGTVFWYKEGKDLIALTHNKGFTEADIQFFTYDQNQHKFAETPVLLSPDGRNDPHYFHKIVKFKNQFFTLIRYANPVNNRPNLLALKRVPEGKLEETDVCLAIPPKEVILGIDAFRSEKGKEQLLLTYYSGRYEIYE